MPAGLGALPRVVCSSCGRPLAEGEVRLVPRIILWGTAFAFAFMHAGNWVFRMLGGSYCARCRFKAVGAALLAACVILAAAAFAIRAWLELVFAVAK